MYIVPYVPIYSELMMYAGQYRYIKKMEYIANGEHHMPTHGILESGTLVV